MLQRKMSKSERVRLEAEREEIRWVLSDRRGRNVVWWLLQRAGIYRTSFMGDANSTAFNEGQRNIGLALHSRMIDADPGSYIRMLQERQDEVSTAENDDDDGSDSDARG